MNTLFRLDRNRRGSSYLEIQVAMVLLSIGMAGLYSMSVVQTKQTMRLAQVLPADQVAALNPTADAWARKLAVYATVEGATTPALDVVPYAYEEQLIDNADGGVNYYKASGDSYGWTDWSYSGAYLANARYHYSVGNVGSRAEFRFDHLPRGEYEVLITYPNFNSCGNAIPHEIYDNNLLRTTVYVNQKIAPSEVYFDGRWWDRIAVVQIDDDKLKVRQLDGPNSQTHIIADAFMVRSARSFDLLSVAKTPESGATAVLRAP